MSDKKTDEQATNRAAIEIPTSAGIDKELTPQATRNQESHHHRRARRTYLTCADRNRLLGGFTLLELLVVIVIIGLLTGLVAPRFFDTVAKSKVKVARAQMDALEKALDQYRLEVGGFPTPEQGLEALISQPPGVPRWQGPYLKKGVPLDPWGHAYIYKLSELQRDVDLISLGSDGQPGGSGDAKDIALSSPE